MGQLSEENYFAAQSKEVPTDSWLIHRVSIEKNYYSHTFYIKKKYYIKSHIKLIWGHFKKSWGSDKVFFPSYDQQKKMKLMLVRKRFFINLWNIK